MDPPFKPYMALVIHHYDTPCYMISQTFLRDLEHMRIDGFILPDVDNCMKTCQNDTVKRIRRRVMKRLTPLILTVFLLLSDTFVQTESSVSDCLMAERRGKSRTHRIGEIHTAACDPARFVVR